jgi:hypothetical protein
MGWLVCQVLAYDRDGISLTFGTHYSCRIARYSDRRACAKIPTYIGARAFIEGWGPQPLTSRNGESLNLFSQLRYPQNQYLILQSDLIRS